MNRRLHLQLRVLEKKLSCLPLKGWGGWWTPFQRNLIWSCIGWWWLHSWQWCIHLRGWLGRKRKWAWYPLLCWVRKKRSLDISRKSSIHPYLDLSTFLSFRWGIANQVQNQEQFPPVPEVHPDRLPLFHINQRRQTKSSPLIGLNLRGEIKSNKANLRMWLMMFKARLQVWSVVSKASNWKIPTQNLNT